VQFLARLQRMVWLHYATDHWWQAEIWDAEMDARIPRRPHEPWMSKINMLRIGQPWLREATRLWLADGVTRELIRISTAVGRHNSICKLAVFLTERGIDLDLLSADRPGLNGIARDFATFCRDPVGRGVRRARIVQAPGANAVLNDVAQLFEFAADNADELRRFAGVDAWGRVGAEHTLAFRRMCARRGEVARKRAEIASGEKAYSDAEIAMILARATVLALPESETFTYTHRGQQITVAGLGQEQAYRMLLLQIKTGRRMSELALIDFDPLLPLLNPPQSSDTDSDDRPMGGVAWLRYQQTKIDGSSDRIVVDQECVDLVHAQQEWLRRFLAEQGSDVQQPRYLFVAPRQNRHGNRPYRPGHYYEALGQFVHAARIHDERDQPLPLTRTHQFRHTVATNFANSGVPVHVLQRFLGHATPAMSMHYVAIRDETAEQAFLNLVKIGADGQEVPMDRTSMYDLLQLDRGTDRVLPNGLCLLPPGDAGTNQNADRPTAAAARAANRPADDRVQRLAARTPPGDRRPGTHHRAPGRTPRGPTQPPGRRSRCPRRAHTGVDRAQEEATGMTDTAPDRQQRVERLTAAAKARTQRAEQRAEKAIRRMLRDQQSITFRGVHRESGLSLDFLYSNEAVRSRIEHARGAQRGRTVSPLRPAGSDGGDGTVIRVLTNQLQAAKRAHRCEADQLRQQLAAATGEILVLRERVRSLETGAAGKPDGG
jgi:integrase